MPSASGPRFGGTRRAGVADVGLGPVHRGWRGCCGGSAAASTGSAVTAGARRSARIAASTSANTSSGASSSSATPVRMSSATAGEGGSQAVHARTRAAWAHLHIVRRSDSGHFVPCVPRAPAGHPCARRDDLAFMTPKLRDRHPTTEHVDVLIVGAGISGIGAACHLQARAARQDATRSSRRATRSAAPGTCSATRASARTPTCTRSATRSSRGPSDKAIADGAAILRLPPRDGERERHRPAHPLRPPVVARRVVERRRRAGPSRSSAPTPARPSQLTAGWLFCASGYYRYDEGYTPELAGRERFGGPVVHPQHWPEDLDYAGKRVVVIGSGATAVTLVPAMADDGRARDDAPALAELRPAAARRDDPSPTGCASAARRRSARTRSPAARTSGARRARLRLCQRFPRSCARLIRCDDRQAAARATIDVDTHFNPHYDPWDQRLCAVPGRRPVPGAAQGRGVGRHRPHRDLHRARHPARVRRASSRPTSSSPRPA